MIALGPTVKVAWDESELVLDARLEMWGDEPARWNGWVCPWFDRENTQKIVDYNKAADDSYELDQFEWDGDVLLIQLGSYPDEPMHRLGPDVDDAGVLRWPVGNSYWTWYEVVYAPGELTEMYGK